MERYYALPPPQKYRPLLDNEHVRQDGPLGLGQNGPIYYALLFLVLFKYWYNNKDC